MSEFYRNEKPTPSPGGYWGGGGGGGGGGSPGGYWGGGGGGGTSPGTPSEPSEPTWHLIYGSLQSSFPQILTGGDGFIQLDSSGYILAGSSGCIDVSIYCQIQGTNSSSHVDCILLAFVIDNSASSVDYDAMLANLRLPNGSVRIRAKWQAGHYDYTSIHTVRFRIAGQVTPWVKLPLGSSYLDVAEIAVRNGQITVASARSM